MYVRMRLLHSSVPSSMKRAVDDFNVMVTRKESFTCIAKAVTVLMIFGLGAAAGLWWAAAGPRKYYDNDNVTSFTFPSTTVYVGRRGGEGVCCRPHPDPDFADFVAPTRLMHGMTDEQLFWRATMVPAAAEYPFERTPKVAFMFLAGRGVLPLAPLWERFFRGHEDRFSVYVHAPPGVAINVSVDSPFYGRQIPSQRTSWGSVTLMDAEKRLLANALLDFSNERFVLLSESCIPVHNFSTVYEYLVESRHSFVEVYRNSKQCRGRYSRRMAPDITAQQWRKGSQWFEMARDVARSIVTDTRYYPLFRRHCRPSCYPDEHYVHTYVNMRHGASNSNRTVTYVDWPRSGPHPAVYGAGDVTPEFIQSIRMSPEPCMYNGRLVSTCYLFARKFAPNALDPLLNISSTVMEY